MKIEFYNCPAPQPQEPNLLGDGIPGFVSYKPNFELLESTAEKFRHFKNFLVIGHGGSITSFYGLYEAFPYVRDRNFLFLSTTDPDYIHRLKEFLRPKDSAVIVISKSGTTVTLLEALSQFLDFPLLFITEPGTPLEKIAEKLKAAVYPHPPIGGRYTGMTEVALLPAALAGLNPKNLYDGARKFYEEYRKDNLAFKAASVFYQLEQDGYVDVFMPFYSHDLFGLSNLIVQLCHESFGKNGLGQTYFAHEAPESQHHTNQRFFGGRKNMAALFTGVDHFHHDGEVTFPASLHSVALKNHTLFDLGKLQLSQSMQAELHGTLEDARINGIPSALLSLTEINYDQVGALMAFWQLYAVYASLLRQVDPFNQPQVENSKLISFDKRLKFKGLS